MEQTALNLIAISIFLMTFSALLSPLLHLSPFIPAATTLGIMGLITLDTLNWQGKGVTLLLDLFTSSRQRKRVIYHEAGHFLAAYFLGIPIKGYTLTAWEAFQKKQPGFGGVQFDMQILSDQVINPQEIPLIVERFCTVLMAGTAAELITYGDSQGGEDDRQKIQEVLNLVGLPTIAYQQKERWALLQAKNLIQKYQTAYEALVDAMEKRLSVEECYRLLMDNG